MLLFAPTSKTPIVSTPSLLSLRHLRCEFQLPRRIGEFRRTTPLAWPLVQIPGQQNPEPRDFTLVITKLLVSRFTRLFVRLMQSASMWESVLPSSQKAARSAQPKSSLSASCIVPLCRVVSPHTWLDPNDKGPAKALGYWVGHSVGPSCQAERSFF